MVDDQLVIVPCGYAKIWDKNPQAGPTTAKNVYVGPPFTINRKYAESLGSRWLILSAKHGFIHPDFIIPEMYDVTFLRKSSGPVTPSVLRDQVIQQGLQWSRRIIGLGGHEYRQAIVNAFERFTVEMYFPFAGLPVGKAMQATNRAIESGRPLESLMFSSLVQSRDSVLMAMEEFDHLGRDQFLKKYGYRRSKSFVLVANGRHYDSKAIVGVAHGYENPRKGPLRSADFSGGAATVQRWLRQLGFEVANRPAKKTTAKKRQSPTLIRPKDLRGKCVEEKCGAIHQWFSRLIPFEHPIPLDKIPKNGIYILFERDESAHGTNRIVRIGTHTGKNQLRARLSQHFINEKKDRSIFRKNIGRCLLSRTGDPFLEKWDLDLTTRRAKELYGDQVDLSTQEKIEKRVSDYLRWKMSFVVFEVPDKKDRLHLEARIISTVSNCTKCGPSKGWLGSQSPKQKIRDSGLWQVNELYKEPLSQEDLVTLFEQLSVGCGDFLHNLGTADRRQRSRTAAHYEPIEPDEVRRRMPQFSDNFMGGREEWSFLNRKFSVDDYVATYEMDESTHIAVRILEWGGPGTPLFCWVIAQRLPVGTPKKEIELAIQSKVEDTTFFGDCVECHERQPAGYMHGDDYCMGCASRNHGIVY